MTKFNIGDRVKYAVTTGFCTQVFEGEVTKINGEGTYGVAFGDGEVEIIEEHYLSPVEPQTHRVFVYGSLKRGFWNNRLLTRSRFAGEAVTPANYKMLSGGFPVLIETKAGEGSAVAGELYHVDDATLRRLDQLESEGRMYKRKVIEVVENGEPVQAYIYVGITGRWGGWRPYTRTNERGELDWNPDAEPAD